MNIHEYQAKSLLKRYNILVPEGDVAYTAQEARETAKTIDDTLWVVKAQIHAGGRGAGYFVNDPEKKGGVRIARSLDQVYQESEAMLGQTLVTKQTGPSGKVVHRLYIEQGLAIEREYYLALLLDRERAAVTLVVSSQGGIAIEDVAAQTPEKILTLRIDPSTGLKPHHIRRVLSFLDVKQAENLPDILSSLYQAFLDCDALLLEINPLIVSQGRFQALDAKMTIDDNALFRQKEIQEMDDESEKDPIEFLANQNGLSYVKLDGNIGCMVNGAGLAMATMDIIQLAGGQPANFLDVGGGASKDQVKTALTLILSDPNVKAILINIFGGIMRCDVIAQGLIEAAQTVNLTLPLVVRLAGTNVDLGKQILANSSLAVITADTLEQAADKAVHSL